MNTNTSAAVLTIALALAPGACASSPPLPPPTVHHSLGASTVAWVEPFDVEDTVFVGDHFDHPKEVVRDRLVSSLVDRLRTKGFDATIVASAPVSGEGLVIRGTLDLVDAGDRRKRAMWGPSAGHPEFRCTAQIYNLAVSATEPAATVTVSGQDDDKDWVNRAIYPSFGDAAAAAGKIVKFIVGERR